MAPGCGGRSMQLAPLGKTGSLKPVRQRPGQNPFRSLDKTSMYGQDYRIARGRKTAALCSIVLWAFPLIVIRAMPSERVFVLVGRKRKRLENATEKKFISSYKRRIISKVVMYTFFNNMILLDTC